MTKDRDFVEMLQRLGPPPKVAWVTCGNTSNARRTRPDDNAVAERRDGLENGHEGAGQVAVQADRTGRVRDADVHGSCMQVDAGVESVWLIVRPHDGLLGLGRA
jgi:hypothetical protein